MSIISYPYVADGGNWISRFATLLYTPEGKKITEKLWQETMAELSFAKPLDILESMKKE